jgi:hypothetical protein
MKRVLATNIVLFLLLVLAITFTLPFLKVLAVELATDTGPDHGLAWLMQSIIKPVPRGGCIDYYAGDRYLQCSYQSDARFASYLVRAGLLCWAAILCLLIKSSSLRKRTKSLLVNGPFFLLLLYVSAGVLLIGGLVWYLEKFWYSKIILA